MSTKRSSQAQFILDQIEKHNYKIIAEVGVWKGNTARNILSTNPPIDEYWEIDQWNLLGDEHGHMGQSKMGMDLWDKLYLRNAEDMRWFKPLRVVRAKSEDAAKLFYKGYFDFVFIDASHFKDDVKNDVKHWLPLVRKGGMLTGHDYGTSRHKGVKLAVDEIFGKRVIVFPNYIWGVEVK